MIDIWNASLPLKNKPPELTEQHVLTEDNGGQRRPRCDVLLTCGPHWSDSGGLLSLDFTRFFAVSWFSCAWYSTRTMLSVSVPPPQCLRKPMTVPHRHMFGPGPSNVPPRILEAGANPVIGHMHPEMFEVAQKIY